MRRKALKYTVLMYVIVILCVAAVASLAHGQIEVPLENKEYVPIPVTVKYTVPEGAEIKKGPGLVWPEGVNKIEIGPGQFVVCAPPGEYTISYRVSWLHIQPITFVDGSGKTITIQSYLGSADIDEKVTFKVLGGTPPVPPPPPPPPGSRWGLLLRETKGGQDPALGNLLIKLREKFQDGRLIIHDPTTVPENLKPLIPSVAQTALMVLARQPDGTDKLVKVVPVSGTTTVEAVEKELK